MSFGPRPTSTLPYRQPSSASQSSSANSQTSALQSRINEKKLELESLRQLRDLSAGLAGQMQQLEEKLATLSGGTEAVAAVMGNWGNVLRAVGMASAKIPKPKDDDGQEAEERVLPQTLVRIPIQQAEMAAKEQENNGNGE